MDYCCVRNGGAYTGRAIVRACTCEQQTDGVIRLRCVSAFMIRDLDL